MEVFIKITAAGVNSGPLFNLFQDSDSFASPFATDVALSTLQTGDTYTIDNASTQVKIVDIGGVCSTELILTVVMCETTTTTSTIEQATTTTTSTNEPVVTTTTTTTVCMDVNLTGYSNVSAIDACSGVLPGIINGDSASGLLSECTEIYLDDCSTPAPAGFYMYVGGHWREWNGSTFVDSGIESCP